MGSKMAQHGISSESQFSNQGRSRYKLQDTGEAKLHSMESVQSLSLAIRGDQHTSCRIMGKQYGTAKSHRGRKSDTARNQLQYGATKMSIHVTVLQSKKNKEQVAWTQGNNYRAEIQDTKKDNQQDHRAAIGYIKGKGPRSQGYNKKAAIQDIGRNAHQEQRAAMQYF